MPPPRTDTAPCRSPTGRSFRLLLEYDGTDFEGWQAQRGGHRTVQGVLEDAIERVVGLRVPVVGAGRTDAGVHARAQAASAQITTGLAAPALRKAINAVLPRDLAVVELAPAPDGFHARYWATAKHYRYQVWNGPDRSPHREREWGHVRKALDVPAMARAAGDLVGRHDFAAFRGSGSSVRTSVRRLMRAEVGGSAGGEIVFDVEGEGFLRHMVRNLAGTLLEVGQGRRPADSMPSLLAARDRGLAGPTAPARGLCLVSVTLAPGPPERRPEEGDSD